MNGGELLMPGPAFYIAWAYGFAIACVIAEILLVRRRKRTILKHLSLMQRPNIESPNP
jgi:heme exporter protein CcmD